MPKDKGKKEKGTGRLRNQNIPEEVLKQLPPEVKAQLGYVEEQKPIFKGPPGGVNAGLSDSIDRLREGFEKIGLTLIGRMGEFASTLERVVMTVARIEKVENLTAEITYFLKNLQKAIDGFKRDFNKGIGRIDSIEIDIERIAKEMIDFKDFVANRPIAAPASLSLQPRAVSNSAHNTPLPSANVVNTPKSTKPPCCSRGERYKPS